MGLALKSSPGRMQCAFGSGKSATSQPDHRHTRSTGTGTQKVLHLVITAHVHIDPLRGPGTPTTRMVFPTLGSEKRTGIIAGHGRSDGAS